MSGPLELIGQIKAEGTAIPGNNKSGTVWVPLDEVLSFLYPGWSANEDVLSALEDLAESLEEVEG